MSSIGCLVRKACLFVRLIPALLLLGDVGQRRVYLLETPTKVDRAAESPQTLTYVSKDRR
jgi:hypothetical protein